MDSKINQLRTDLRRKLPYKQNKLKRTSIKYKKLTCKAKPEPFPFLIN